MQCCAMALATIVRATVFYPSDWTTNTLNENMIEGDNLYNLIRVNSNEEPNAHPIPENGFLNVQNSDVEKKINFFFSKF